MSLNIDFDYKVPRLGVGAGPADGSRMCAMQVISWENGDTTITDLPACSDPMLARIVQSVNDAFCDHRDGDLLCPECSIKVLDLAHRTVGTGTLGLPELDRRRVWVRVAADQARQVSHLVREEDREACEAAIVAAECWADDPSKANKAEAEKARIATYSSAYYAAFAAYYAAYAAENAANATVNATYATASAAAVDAAAAAVNATYAAYAA